MDSNKIQIMLCANDKVKDDILVLLLSIIKNVSAPVDIHFLTADFTFLKPEFIKIKEENAKFFDSLLKEKWPDANFIVHDITDLVSENLKKSKNKKTTYSPYCLLRLFSAKLDYIPEKILYLDTDTIVAKDIKDLYETDLSNYDIAAVRDFYGRHWINKNYCNSGVLLLNIKAIREGCLFDKCIEMVQKKRMFMPDQSAINKYCKRKLYLPDEYNYQNPKMGENIVIHHFSKKIFYLPFFHTVNIKAHNVEKVHSFFKIHEYDDILNKYLELKNNLV